MKPTAKTKKKPAPKPTAKAKTKAVAKKKPSATDDLKTLGALDADRYEKKPDVSIAKHLYAAKALHAAASRNAKQLVEGSLLSRNDIDSIAQRTRILETCERKWILAREHVTPVPISKARDKGTALRTDAIAALRYFLAGNAEVQTKVDAIMEGTSDVDLVDDLRKCAELVETHSAALKRADLPKNPSAALRSAADTLEDGLLDRDNDEGSRTALALRNRAFWWLQESMSNVRAAGRYVFRNDPTKFDAFVDNTRRDGRSSSRKPDNT